MPERPAERMLRRLKPKEEKPTLEKREAQMVCNLAKAELKRRKAEFLQELRNNTHTKPLSSIHTEVYIELPGIGKVAEMVLYTGSGTNENLLIAKIGVGEYTTKKDALRDLGIGSYLIQVTKEYALKHKYPGLTLDCEKELVGFYKKLGFVVKRKSGLKPKTKVQMDFDFPKM